MGTFPDDLAPEPDETPATQSAQDTTPRYPLTPTQHARLRQLFETYHHPLCEFAAAFGEWEDAEDAVQQVFIVLTTKRGDLLDRDVASPDVEQELRAYLYSSTRGQMLNLAQKRGSRNRKHAQADEPTLSHSLRPPDEQFEEQERRARLRACYEAALEILSAQQRAVIVRLYEEGGTYEEIGRDLGITSGAAKRHAARGLAKMRQSEIFKRFRP